MNEILETTQLEFDKSAFLIDLVEHTNGSLFIEITQTINDDIKDGQSIKVNPSVLSEIIQVLQNYQAKIPKNQIGIQRHLTELDKEKIKNYYLKGVSVKDLSIQLDQSEELIEMVLRNKRIPLVSNEPPKTNRWMRRKRYQK